MKMKHLSLFQITMSQAAPSDMDLSVDTALPPGQPSDADAGSCQDVEAALTRPSAPLQPTLIPDSVNPPQSTEETTTEDTAPEADASEGHTDQPEPPAEGQVIECDQPVSLEPDAEAAEEDVEVCSTQFFHLLLSFLIL